MLQHQGYEVLTAAAQGLAGASDSAIAEKAQKETCCLVTLDLGFGDVRAYPPENYAGIVIIRPHRQDRDSIQALARVLLATIDRGEPLAGRLWIIEPGCIRIHEPEEKEGDALST
jgi:predicted nuclease of predicted toxin-antitoxin system